MHPQPVKTHLTGVVITGEGVVSEAWLATAAIVGVGAVVGVSRNLDPHRLGAHPFVLAVVVLCAVTASLVGACGTARREDRAVGYRDAVRRRLIDVTGLPLPVDVYDRLWRSGECTVVGVGFGEFVLRADESRGRQVLLTAPAQFNPTQHLGVAVHPATPVCEGFDFPFYEA